MTVDSALNEGSDAQGRTAQGKEDRAFSCFCINSKMSWYELSGANRRRVLQPSETFATPQPTRVRAVCAHGQIANRFLKPVSKVIWKPDHAPNASDFDECFS